MIGLIIAVLLALGILRPQIRKILFEGKVWIVFLMIELALLFTKYWLDILVGLAWILLWVFLIMFAEHPT